LGDPSVVYTKVREGLGLERGLICLPVLCLRVVGDVSLVSLEPLGVAGVVTPNRASEAIPDDTGERRGIATSPGWGEPREQLLLRALPPSLGRGREPQRLIDDVAIRHRGNYPFEVWATQELVLDDVGLLL
jgi:hypothetical protein